MTEFPRDLLHPALAGLPRYNAGMAADVFRARYGTDVRAKLDSNESGRGPSPAAVTAMAAVAAGAQRYSDAGCAGLTADLAVQEGVAPGRIVTGNGSEDLIDAIYRAVLREGDHVVTICPSFGLHELNAQACGARVTKVDFTPDWRFPVEGLVAAMGGGCRILIFASPSNPVGTAIEEGDFVQLVAGTPAGTLIVFDEAYREFLTAAQSFDAYGILDASGHAWISLRTFSKAYALAGARVGYGVCSHEELAGAIQKTRAPFAVNAFAEAGARAALADAGWLAEGLAETAELRARLVAGLTQKGYATAPSAANFVFFDTGRANAAELAEALRGHGVLIKAWAEAGWQGWARVSTGDAAELGAFLDALPPRG